MARTVTIPDGLAALIESQRKAQGLPSLDDAVVAILTRALARQGVPTVPSDPKELEAELLKGVRSPSRSPTRQEWQAKKDALDEQHRRSQAG